MKKLKTGRPYKRKKIQIITGILLFVSTFCFGMWFFGRMVERPSLSYRAFKEQADRKEKEAVIGTNIVLHQKIYGVGTVQYRYKLETDCPYWKYEDRYVTEDPLPMSGPPDAVETIAKSLTTSWNGETLASGQHFYVPLLDLNSDDQSEAEYEDALYKQAYIAYQGGRKTTRNFVFWASLGYVALWCIRLWLIRKSSHIDTRFIGQGSCKRNDKLLK